MEAQVQYSAETLKTGYRELSAPSGPIEHQSATEIFDLWALPLSLRFPVFRNGDFPTVAA